MKKKKQIIELFLTFFPLFADRAPAGGGLSRHGGPGQLRGAAARILDGHRGDAVARLLRAHRRVDVRKRGDLPQLARQAETQPQVSRAKLDIY